MSEELMLSIEKIPFPTLCVDNEGKIINCNSDFEQLTHYDKNDLADNSLEVLLNKHCLASYQAHEKQLKKGQVKGGEEFELEFLSNGEQLLQCSVTLTTFNKLVFLFVRRIVDNQFSICEPQYQKTQTILNGIDEAYWEWNIEKDSIYHSKRFMALFGYKEKPFVGSIRFWEQHVDPKYLKKVYQQNAAHFNGDTAGVNLTFPVITKDSEKRWINLVGKVIEYQYKTPIKMFGIIKDVTEQQEGLVYLKKQNQYMHLAEKINHTGHWRVDLVKQSLYWSSGVYYIHGVTPKTYTPNLDSAIAFYTENEQAKVKQYLEIAIEKKKAFRFKSTIINKQGKRLKVESLGDVELDENGSVIAVFGVFRDITKAEEGIEKLKLMALVNHAIKVPIFFINEKDTIVHHELSPQKDNKNSALFDYINFSISEYLDFKKKTKKEGQLVRHNVSFDNFNSVFDISITYEKDNGIYIWIIENITDKFRKEQQQIISNRLALLGNTFGNVSHDINNVLGVALGATEMLELKYSMGEKDISNYIERVKNAIDKGKDVTARLLAFTRRPTVSVIEFDPMEEIETNKYLFKQLLLSTIDFTLDIDGVHCEIMFPQGEFINILLNLVLNSQDAIREGGLIGKIAISANINADKNLEIHVKDSGIGIKQENIAKIFDPFYSSKSVNKGNGIGLANVYSTMYKNNGEIFVKGNSDLGGAVFTLVFKCKVKSGLVQAPQVKIPKKKIKFTGQRVLILDDEVSIGEFIALYLESKNVTAYHVANKADLKTMLEEEAPFDVFITDMILPDISGREAVEIVLDKYPDITVYSVSGYIGEEDRKWHYPVLRKPFNSQELEAFLSAEYVA